MRSGEFLAISATGVPSDNPVLYPTWGPLGLELDPGEIRVRAATLQSVRCTEGPKRRELWALSGKKIDVEVTDHRVAYFCDKFTKGGGFTLTEKAISGAIAMSRRAGKAAIGQIRFDWPTSVACSAKSTLGMTFLYFTIAEGDYEISMRAPKGEASTWAAQIAQMIAGYRLARQDELGLDEDARALLKQHVAEPTAHLFDEGKSNRFVYYLPGATFPPPLTQGRPIAWAGTDPTSSSPGVALHATEPTLPIEHSESHSAQLDPGSEVDDSEPKDPRTFDEVRNEYPGQFDVARSRLLQLTSQPKRPTAWLRELCKRLAAGSPVDAAVAHIPLDWEGPEPAARAPIVTTTGELDRECEFGNLQARHPASFERGRSLLADLTEAPDDPKAWLDELCTRIDQGSPPEAAATRIPLDWRPRS